MQTRSNILGWSSQIFCTRSNQSGKTNPSSSKHRRRQKCKAWTGNCVVMRIKWWRNTITIINSKPTRWKTIVAKLSTNPSTYSFWNKHILHPKKPSMQEKWSGSLGSCMPLPIWKWRITCNMQNVLNWLGNVQLANRVW